jgi:hypothetical protein
MSMLLDKMQGKAQVTTILFYPGSIEGTTGLRFTDLKDREALGNRQSGGLTLPRTCLAEVNGGPVAKEQYDLKLLADDDLWALEALFAKAQCRPAHKPELLVPETLARIAKG